MTMSYVDMSLAQLSANSPKTKLHSVGISKEAGRVFNNLLDMEVRASICAVVQHSSLERAGQATVRSSSVIGALWIRNGYARWARCTLGCFVNMRRCNGGGLVVACYTRECDVLRGISKVLVQSRTGSLT